MKFQLPLNVALRDDATLANYYPGDNGEAVGWLRGLGARTDRTAIYLWGGGGAGKTHLLQAACHDAGARGASAAYLPLMQFKSSSTSVTEGLERLLVVCIDDVHAVAGDPNWEEALFHLFNRCRERGAHLIVGGNATPAALGLGLADLASRLSGGMVFHLRSLDDEQMMAALQLRAERRGIELPADVARYLLRRCDRDMNTLASLLERLDHASLAAQRRLTIPFVRQWL
jgi:DnaA family protein